jgi:hypothetical protein
MEKRNDNLALQSICLYLQVNFLHAIKSYNMGPLALFPPLKVGVLWIFIALKNLSPRLSLNPQNLGPMASILTITPQRQLYLMILS